MELIIARSIPVINSGRVRLRFVKEVRAQSFGCKVAPWVEDTAPNVHLPSRGRCRRCHRSCWCCRRSRHGHGPLKLPTATTFSLFTSIYIMYTILTSFIYTHIYLLYIYISWGEALAKLFLCFFLLRIDEEEKAYIYIYSLLSNLYNKRGGLWLRRRRTFGEGGFGGELAELAEALVRRGAGEHVIPKLVK